MLSKYLHGAVMQKDDDRARYEADLNNYLQREFASSQVLSVNTNGTLGLFYQTTVDGKTCFIKTHQASLMCQQNLRKEAQLLDILYGSELMMAFFSIDGGSGERDFFLIEELQQLAKEIDCNAVLDLIHSTQSILNAEETKNSKEYFDPKHDNLSYVIDQGQLSLQTLCQEHLLSDELFDAIAGLQKPELERQATVCHGDLSDKNILQKGSKLYAIDWEDAILASKGYDYLYWLSFFSKRKYYSQAGILEASGYNNQEARFLMSMIVAVKCMLSWKAGTWRNDSLSFAQRLEEILAIK